MKISNKYLQIIIILLFLLIQTDFIMKISTAESYYVIYGDNPIITTDKDTYFLNENITINANWTIYFPPDEEVSASIIFIENNLENYDLNNIYENSLYYLELENNNGNNSHEISVNSSLFANYVVNSTLIHIYLLIHEIPIIPDTFNNYHKNISIKRYTPVFKNEYQENIKIKFNENYYFSNLLVAFENQNLVFINNYVSIKIYNDDTLIYGEQQYLNSGNIVFNFSKFIYNEIGEYYLNFEIPQTSCFLYNIISISIEILPDYCTIELVNNSLNLDLNANSFKIKGYVKDNQNNYIYPNSITWTTNLSIEKIEYYDNYFILNILYPDKPGNYTLILHSNNINYNISDFQCEITFKTNYETLDNSKGNRSKYIIYISIISSICILIIVERKKSNKKVVPLNSIRVF